MCNAWLILTGGVAATGAYYCWLFGSGIGTETLSVERASSTIGFRKMAAAGALYGALSVLTCPTSQPTVCGVARGGAIGAVAGGTFPLWAGPCAAFLGCGAVLVLSCPQRKMIVYAE